MTTTQIIGAFIVLLILWSLIRAHKDKSFHFNIYDLLMENNRVSRIACMAMGAFVVATWIVVDLQVNGKLTEGFFIAYLGRCLTPFLLNLTKDKEQTNNGTNANPS